MGMGLIFRNILKVDIDTQGLVREWRNSDNIRKYMYNENIISEESHSNWIKTLRNTNKKEVYVILYNDLPIGIISVDDIDFDNKRCEWAFYIYDTSLRGKGIGKRLEVSMIDYIFNELGMEKLNCAVLETNPNVIEMHKKFGFQVEGIRRGDIIKDGKRVDIYELGMQKERWLANRVKINIPDEDLAVFEKWFFMNRFPTRQGTKAAKV